MVFGFDSPLKYELVSLESTKKLSFPTYIPHCAYPLEYLHSLGKQAGDHNGRQRFYFLQWLNLPQMQAMLPLMLQHSHTPRSHTYNNIETPIKGKVTNILITKGP